MKIRNIGKEKTFDYEFFQNKNKIKINLLLLI